MHHVVTLQGEKLEKNSLHSVETGLCMLAIEKCTKGKQENWWVWIQACVGSNPMY